MREMSHMAVVDVPQSGGAIGVHAPRLRAPAAMRPARVHAALRVFVDGGIDLDCGLTTLRISCGRARLWRTP
jgi:hypothetical protein